MIKAPESQNKLETQRFIGHIEGTEKGPTLLFFGGIHGNEKSGVTALEHVFQQLQKASITTKGNFYGIRGNIPALLRDKRYMEKDLNRIWSTDGIQRIRNTPESELLTEEQELLEILRIVSDILTTRQPPFYFVDLHTTSSRTLPFITINDALINRKFSRLFPVPIILGIEEFLEGPLLSYINEKGYVSLGFESGQHTELSAVKNSISFTWLALVYSGFLNREDVPDLEQHYRQLEKSAKSNGNFYEVVHRHALPIKNGFKMLKGFQSFEKVSQGTPLAKDGKNQLEAPYDTIIFMPLYQEQGEEGFFLIRRIPKWALAWSAFLRRVKIHGALTILPGISWKNREREELLVNLKVAKFLTKPFFHLLGYRQKAMGDSSMLMQNRERTAKNESYANEWWYYPKAQKYRDSLLK